MFWNKFPYSDFHEINLDWILAEIKKLHNEYNDFVAVNTIKDGGVWDVTKQYESWTVVTDGGHGYISVRPVPAGVALTNESYWKMIADFTIFWDALAEKVADLEDEMETLLDTTIPGINSDIDDLNDKVSLLMESGRKFIFIADSYAGTSQWVAKVNSKLGLTANVNSFCNAVGGEGFTTGADGNGFLGELQTHAGNMSADLRSTITDIMVIGGANDAETDQTYGSNTIEANFATFVSYARLQFPNAKIHIGFIGFCWYNSSTLENRTQKNLEMTCYHYKDSAAYHGCSYMTGIEYTTRWLPKLTTNADGLHPNSTSGLIISNGVAQYILGAPIITSIERYPLTATNVIGSGSVDVEYSIYNEEGRIEVGELAIVNYTGTINAGNSNSAYANRTHIADLSGVFFNKPVTAQGFVFVSGAENAPNCYPAEYMFYGDELTVLLANASSGGWASVSPSNDIVIFSPFVARFESIALG